MTTAPRIVMVGWRGPLHPRSGGAERYTEHALRGLARRGAKVTWLVPAVKGQPAEERWGLIDIVRAGRGLGHVVAAGRYLRRHGDDIDLVIDQFNAYPMLTPLWFRGARMMLLHHRMGEAWFAHLPWPLATIGNAMELALLRTYRQHPVVTVSENSANDLRERCFSDVTVVHNAVDLPSTPVAERSRPPARPLFVAVGRLVPNKRFEHAIQALELVRRELPDAQLIVMGRGTGSYVDALSRRCADTEGVRLIVNASDDQKWRLLYRATALVATSIREGWGLTATEAHAMGTPTIVYDVPGLRESTRHGRDGLVCPAEPTCLAEAMVRVACDADLWSALSAEARKGAERWTPNRLETEFAIAVDATLRRAGLPPLAPVVRNP